MTGQSFEQMAENSAELADTALLASDRELAELHQQMLKFARLQLQDASIAEDVVQESILAALKHRGSFQRQSALKTWVFAILKNKIIDQLRYSSRFLSSGSLGGSDDDADDTALFEMLFNKRGMWSREAHPVAWKQPDDELENDNFWLVFDTCLNRLPASYGRYFMMREFLGLTTEEICVNEALTANNLNVTLYRARTRLRECLQQQWFESESHK